jgi:ATPase subunit of ABC transporter with duplicated ATPase domains
MAAERVIRWLTAGLWSALQRSVASRGRLSGASKRGSRSCCPKCRERPLLLLDEPTDNLDLESADALQDGLESYEGTVLAVTHDRWFARTFDRFLIFGANGVVRETSESYGTNAASIALSKACLATFDVAMP